MHQEVPYPPQPEDEVQYKLSDEEGSEGGFTVCGAVPRHQGAGGGAGAVQEGGGIVEGLRVNTM